MAMWLLWIFSLAASFLLPATGEVLESFFECKEFFLDGKDPNLEPINPARICQLYKNKYRFATMYDKNGRIPMFSAYKYERGKGNKPTGWIEWMIEPQLALPGDQNRKSMESEETCKIDGKKLNISQAVERDYTKGALYDKGHMAPPSHQPDYDSKYATFTLTNIVPQLRQLNNGNWSKYEREINITGCQDTYVIVGAVPGIKSINNRVIIPSHIWAAGCCVLQNNRRRSWAVIAENDKDIVDHLTLKELQEQLVKLYRKEEVDLFNSACNEAQN